MLAVLFSTLMLAATAPTPAAPAAADPAKEPERICHNVKPTGGHFVERVCYTREEAAKAEQAAQDAVNNINRHPKRSEKDPPK